MKPGTAFTTESRIDAHAGARWPPRHLMPLVGRYHSGHSDTSAQVKQVVAQYLDAKRAATPGKPAWAPTPHCCCSRST